MRIDGHTYLDEDKAEALKAYPEQTGLDAAVVLTFAGDEADEGAPFGGCASAERVVEVCKASSGKLIPFAAFDLASEADIEKKLRALKDAGCRGYGEHRTPRSISHPRSQAMYEAAGKLELPVVVHLGLPASGIHPSVREFGRMVDEHYLTNFIASGPGFWAHIQQNPPEDDPLPTGPIRTAGQINEVLWQWPNVFADLSGPWGLNALQRDLDFANSFLKRFWNKIIFGTGFGSRGAGAGGHRALIEKIINNREQRLAILGGNLMGLLKM